MKFQAEVKGVNSGALKIGGKGVKFAPCIRQMSLIQFGHYYAPTFHAYLQAVHLGGNAAQSVVSTVEAVQYARVSGIVQAVGAKVKLESAQSVGGLRQEQILVRGALLANRSRMDGRRRLPLTRLKSRLFIA